MTAPASTQKGPCFGHALECSVRGKYEPVFDESASLEQHCCRGAVTAPAITSQGEDLREDFPAIDGPVITVEEDAQTTLRFACAASQGQRGQSPE